MTIAVVHLDPYKLPLPTPGTPVVPARLTVAMHAHLNSRFADPVWPLAALSANPSARKDAIHWHNCPTVFRDQLRLTTWTMINGELTPTFLKQRSVRLRSRLSVAGLSDTVRSWMHLATWLAAQGITTLAACDTSTLHHYGQHLLGQHANRLTVGSILVALARLWGFDQLSARPTGVARTRSCFAQGLLISDHVRPARPGWMDHCGSRAVVVGLAPSTTGTGESQPVTTNDLNPKSREPQ
jgi:hypothetical protein